MNIRVQHMALALSDRFIEVHRKMHVVRLHRPAFLQVAPGQQRTGRPPAAGQPRERLAIHIEAIRRAIFPAHRSPTSSRVALGAVGVRPGHRQLGVLNVLRSSVLPVACSTCGFWAGRRYSGFLPAAAAPTRFARPVGRCSGPTPVY